MADATDEAEGLDRSLGMWQVTASGVGIIVGAGIYVLIGEATAIAGPRVWLSFLIAAGLSMLTGLSYAELSSMYPKAGAEFEYARQVFPRWASFLVGWVMFVGLIVATAAVSLGFGQYLGGFLDVSRQEGAFLLLAGIGAVAFSGIRRSAALTLLLSVVQVAGLVFVVVIGVPHLGEADLLAGPAGSSGLIGSGIIGAAALVFFAFIGFDEVITLAEETRSPTRTVPRALLLALGVSTLLYMGVAVSAVNVIGAEALASSDRPLADVIDHVLGGRGADVVAVIALMATTNTSLLCLTASSRIQYGMAEAGALPPVVGQLGPRSRAPRVAIGLSLVAAAGFVLLGDLSVVASVTDLAVYLVFIAVNVVVVMLRLREPDRPRPFRSPWAIGRVPVLPVLGTGAVLVMLPALRWEALVWGAVLCVVGLLYHLVLRSQGVGGQSEA